MMDAYVRIGHCIVIYHLLGHSLQFGFLKPLASFRQDVLTCSWCQGSGQTGYTMEVATIGKGMARVGGIEGCGQGADRKHWNFPP